MTPYSHKLTTAKKYREERGEEVGRRDLFGGKAQRDGARRDTRRIRESFHAAEVITGGERSWISTAVSLSMTFIGPPHLGQR